MPNKRRSLGQHMLVDRKVLADLMTAADIAKSETVCEAGTGKGILTAELCDRAKIVISFEIDRELYQNARQQLHYQNLKLVSADLFKAKTVDFDVFVSNLPYSRSRDAFEWLATQKFKRAVVMVQQEFADKLRARPGDMNYRAISALATLSFKMQELFPVKKQSFEPQPLVNSVVVRILPRKIMSIEKIRSLNLLFSKRNRKANSIASRGGLRNFDSGESRIDELPVDRLAELVELMLHSDIRSI